MRVNGWECTLVDRPQNGGTDRGPVLEASVCTVVVGYTGCVTAKMPPVGAVIGWLRESGWIDAGRECRLAGGLFGAC